MEEVIYYGRTGTLKRLGEQLTEDAKAFQAEGYEIGEVKLKLNDHSDNHVVTTFTRPANFEELKREERAIIAQGAHLKGYNEGFDACLDRVEELFTALVPGIFAAARARAEGVALVGFDPDELALIGESGECVLALDDSLIENCDCAPGECELDDAVFMKEFQQAVDTCCFAEPECGECIPCEIGSVGSFIPSETLDKLIAVLDKTVDALAAVNSR